MVTVAMLLAWGCGVPRAHWEFERQLLAVDRMADHGEHEDAARLYEVLAGRSHREDLVRYATFRAAEMRWRAGHCAEAFERFGIIARRRQHAYDEEAGRAQLRRAQIAASCLHDEVTARRELEQTLFVYPRTLAAQEALRMLESGVGTREEAAALLGWLSEHYPLVRDSELAAPWLYLSARLLEEELGELSMALVLYDTIAGRMTRTGLNDDAIWRAIAILRQQGERDEERRRLWRFVRHREVTWFMANYDSAYYVPAYQRLAEMAEEEEDWAEALAVYHELLARFPFLLRGPHTRYHMMGLYERLGNLPGMVRMAREIEENHPDSRFVGRARARLDSAGGHAP